MEKGRVESLVEKDLLNLRVKNSKILPADSQIDKIGFEKIENVKYSNINQNKKKKSKRSKNNKETHTTKNRHHPPHNTRIIIKNASKLSSKQNAIGRQIPEAELELTLEELNITNNSSLTKRANKIKFNKNEKKASVDQL